MSVQISAASVRAPAEGRCAPACRSPAGACGV